jgi:shikimate 5-dehydrogenase
VALIDVEFPKADGLAKRLKAIAPKLDVTVLDRRGPLDFRDYDTFYNGTGLGKLSPHANGGALSPLLADDLFPVEGLAIDANYTPWETPFLKRLRERGFATLNGFSHMVGSTALHLAFISGRTLSYATIKRFAEQMVERS